MRVTIVSASARLRSDERVERADRLTIRQLRKWFFEGAQPRDPCSHIERPLLHGLLDYLVRLAPDADFSALEAELLRKCHGLTAPAHDELRRFQC